jgi:hypothetical protein
VEKGDRIIRARKATPGKRASSDKRRACTKAQTTRIFECALALLVNRKVPLLTKDSKETFADIYSAIERLSLKYFHDISGKVSVLSFELVFYLPKNRTWKAYTNNWPQQIPVLGLSQLTTLLIPTIFVRHMLSVLSPMPYVNTFGSLSAPSSRCCTRKSTVCSASCRINYETPTEADGQQMSGPLSRCGHLDLYLLSRKRLMSLIPRTPLKWVVQPELIESSPE